MTLDFSSWYYWPARIIESINTKYMRERISGHPEQPESTGKRVEPMTFLTRYEEAITAADPLREDGREGGFTIVMRILASETQSALAEKMIREIEEEIREFQELNDQIDDAEVAKVVERYTQIVKRLIASGVLVKGAGDVLRLASAE